MKRRKTPSVRRVGSRPNPLRTDPTRTATLRRSFSQEVIRQFALIRDAVIKLILEEDAFGLRQQGIVHPNDLFKQNRRFAFETSAGKVKRFRQWVREQTDLHLTGRGQDELWKAYIEQGYQKGQTRAVGDVSTKFRYPSSTQISSSPFGQSKSVGVKGSSGTLLPSGIGQTSQSLYLQRAFSSQATADKVKLLAGRTFTEMEDVSARMATKMSRRLADGLVKGHTPEQIAKDMAGEVDISKGRALTIVRTELTRAHAEGQLDALEDLGYEDVTAAVEWTTSHTSTVCEMCEPLEGVILKISEARGMLPRHPNCMCSWTIAGEETGQKQKVSKKTIERAVERSLEEGDQSLEDWGPGSKISKRRPI